MFGVVLKITLICLIATQVSGQCKQLCTPTSTAKYTNSYDCTTYYKCMNGGLYLFKCPTGKVWNCLTNSCGNSLFSTCCKNDPNWWNHSTTYSCNLNKNPVIVADSVQVNVYYECVGTFMEQQFCLDGQTFNPQTKICLPDDENECTQINLNQLLITSSITTTKPTTPKTTTKTTLKTSPTTTSKVTTKSTTKPANGTAIKVVSSPTTVKGVTTKGTTKPTTKPTATTKGTTVKGVSNGNAPTVKSTTTKPTTSKVTAKQTPKPTTAKATPAANAQVTTKKSISTKPTSTKAAAPKVTTPKPSTPKVTTKTNPTTVKAVPAVKQDIITKPGQKLKRNHFVRSLLDFILKK